MTIFTGIILYLMIFWLMLFAVLPWGNAPADSAEEGNAAGAPANPRIKQKFIITAIIATIVWSIVAAMIHFDVIDFYDIARQMTEEDLAK
jgi:predicted secreted protein